MFKKISLPVLVTVMCLMISVVLALSWMNQDKQVVKTENDVSDEERIVRTDYTAVVEKTLDWIDQQRNDDGWYILERGCNFNAKTCDTVWDNDEGNKDGLIATWARFNYYQQTQNFEDLESVKDDIDKFYEKYPNGVDNALWICKITYDMWKSELFDEETNKKLKDICFKSSDTFQGLIENNSDYEKAFNKSLSEANKIDPVWKSWDGYAFAVRGFNNYFGLTSDLLAQYLWTGDENKLELARKYFDSADTILSESGYTRADDICLLGLSAIDLYKFDGNNERLLNYVKEKYLSFYDELNGTKRHSTSVCGLMIKSLYQLSGNQVFIDGLERNNRVLSGLLDGDNSILNKTNTVNFISLDISIKIV